MFYAKIFRNCFLRFDLQYFNIISFQYLRFLNICEKNIHFSLSIYKHFILKMSDVYFEGRMKNKGL